MKTHPTALVTRNNPGTSPVIHSAMAKICPFCGERLEYIDHNLQLRGESHSPYSCYPNSGTPQASRTSERCTFWSTESNESAAFTLDQDGDYWLFRPDTDRDGDVTYELVPTTREALIEMLTLQHTALVEWASNISQLLASLKG